MSERVKPGKAVRKAPAKKPAAKKPAAKKPLDEKVLHKNKVALEQAAHEINARMERFEKLGSQADDHRLAAALRLADAKKLCRASKIDFGKWVEKNVKQSYETVRKLLPIGVAESEKAGAGVKLLADLRKGAAKRNRELRERKKANAATHTQATPPNVRAEEAVAALKLDDKRSLLQKTAKDLGVLVMTKNAFEKALKAEAAKAAPAPAKTTKEEPKKTPLEAAVEKRLTLDKLAAELGLTVVDKGKPGGKPEKEISLPPSALRPKAEELFKQLSPKQAVAFAAWCAEQVGAKFTLETVTPFTIYPSGPSKTA